jgi:31-O-methyltransferase
MYNVTHGEFHTPRGKLVTMAYREDSSDYNTLRSCMDEDEYGLKELHLEGVALDVGAHIGGVSVGLALDNPELTVVAIEAVPPNVDLLHQNIEQRGRVIVVAGAASSEDSAIIRWGFEGNESADHHAFIGNSLLPEMTVAAHIQRDVPVVSLDDIVAEYGPISFIKIDCEMCEFSFLRGPALADVALIRGEVHADPTDLVDALSPTHDVTLPTQLPGAFEAVRR